MINKYGDKTNYLYLKTNSDINEYMDKSGVNTLAAIFKYAYAIYQSQRGNKMDYWQSYLGAEMRDLYMIKPADINFDRGDFYIFPSKMIAYNAMDAGNFLWGRGMRELGFDYIDIKYGAEIYTFIAERKADSPYDQAAIKSGFYSK